jgi:hypothetical protein
MQQVSLEAVTITRVSILFWVIAVSAILIAGHWWQRAHEFRDKMLQQWEPALVIALLYMISTIIGGTHIVPFYSIAIFWITQGIFCKLRHMYPCDVC